LIQEEKERLDEEVIIADEKSQKYLFLHFLLTKLERVIALSIIDL